MKIRYTKKRLNHYLIFGILWLVLGTIALVYNADNIFNYGYLIIGTLYLGTCAFQNKYQYLLIENGIIAKNRIVPTRIRLDAIT